ncbi:hypothetical protein GBAR_LOCUS22706 [Geodia barretti]|uniref:Uncharacterized protein n=1 Tax=Geodia barretti TaxID=519541 RepID=A0AA35T433_GEOBA|nr:hypothetical protein GBAR_LOCUS22706 [Geodia barretti]
MLSSTQSFLWRRPRTAKVQVKGAKMEKEVKVQKLQGTRKSRHHVQLVSSVIYFGLFSSSHSSHSNESMSSLQKFFCRLAMFIG